MAIILAMSAFSRWAIEPWPVLQRLCTLYVLLLLFRFGLDSYYFMADNASLDNLTSWSISSYVGIFFFLALLDVES